MARTVVSATKKFRQSVRIDISEEYGCFEQSINEIAALHEENRCFGSTFEETITAVEVEGIREKRQLQTRIEKKSV